MGGLGLWIRGKFSSNGKSATALFHLVSAGLHVLCCMYVSTGVRDILLSCTQGMSLCCVLLLHVNSVSSGATDQTPVG